MSQSNVLNRSIETGEPELRLQNFIQQAPVGMIVLTGESKQVEIVNEMYARLFGRTVEELQGKNLFEIVPEAGEHFGPPIAEVQNSGKPVYLDDHPYTLPGKDGQERSGYLNVICQPYFEAGRISGVMVVCHDVTEDVRSRKKLQQAEEKLRLAIESGDLGTYEFDMRTGRMNVSERFREIWGVQGEVSREELVLRIHPEDQSLRKEAHLQSLITGELFYEARVILGSKEYKWVRVNGRVLFDISGEPTVLLGVVQDITNQRDHTERLNELVQQRTEELQMLNEELATANEELSQSNSQLVAANRDLEQFAYVASHDLQEPLRKLQTFSHLLRDRFSPQLSEGAQVYIEKITSSAARMSHLIKDILDYSRLTHNKPLFQPVDLNIILTNVLSDYELMISQRKITVTADDLPTVEAIPIQMNQLLYNLIGNSIKFVRKDVASRITITCRALTPEETATFGKLKREKKYFRFTVSDNGIGFSQEYADHIFSIFQQLNEKSRFGGYGIGLSLCKRIVENHHGIIFANGVANEGAAFTFILPVIHH